MQIVRSIFREALASFFCLYYSWTFLMVLHKVRLTAVSLMVLLKKSVQSSVNTYQYNSALHYSICFVILFIS